MTATGLVPAFADLRIEGQPNVLDTVYVPDMVFRATIVTLDAEYASVRHGKHMSGGAQHSVVVRALTDVRERWRAESSEGAHVPPPDSAVTSTWLTVVGDMNTVTMSCWPTAAGIKEAAVYAQVRGMDQHRRVAPESFSLAARREHVARMGGYALTIMLPICNGVRAHGQMLPGFEIDGCGGSSPSGYCGLCPVVGPPDHIVVTFQEC
ncbi:hypothetical protein [Nereida ignava]|mgnify:CR=1 FL=1|uniref:hypothetical protein n=1 Tax=Nereida ignava TaxID=282199 RepID=UPI0030FC4F28